MARDQKMRVKDRLRSLWSATERFLILFGQHRQPAPSLFL
ncbi:hypothetical protein ACVILK_003175 [Bradyrhizobium embrapense]